MNIFYDNIQDIIVNAETVVATNSKNKELEKQRKELIIFSS